MARTLIAFALVAILVPLALAQVNSVTSAVTFRQSAQFAATPRGTELEIRSGSGHVGFCRPSSCLYYAGDFDSADSNANGLFNVDDEGASVEGQVWVAVKPDRNVTVTGATFVQFFVEAGVGTNPTPFVVQMGTQLGQAGKNICNTSGNTTESVYGDSQFVMYSYTVKKFSKSCKLKKGKRYYLNLLPTFENNSGYLANVEDAKPKNHYGWKNDMNHCYFNSAYYGDNYVTCNSQGIGNHGFSEFSIALTGK